MVSINAILRRIVLQFRDRGFADVSDANMIVVIMGNTRVLSDKKIEYKNIEAIRNWGR